MLTSPIEHNTGHSTLRTSSQVASITGALVCFQPEPLPELPGWAAALFSQWAALLPALLARAVVQFSEQAA